MKDFSKKFISTAMAIAVMASMSAYAEGNVQTEEVKATNAAVESTCDHFNVTRRMGMSTPYINLKLYERRPDCGYKIRGNDHPVPADPEKPAGHQ